MVTGLAPALTAEVFFAARFFAAARAAVLPEAEPFAAVFLAADVAADVVAAVFLTTVLFAGVLLTAAFLAEVFPEEDERSAASSARAAASSAWESWSCSAGTSPIRLTAASTSLRTSAVRL